MRDWEKLKLKGCQNIIIIYRKIKHSSEKISTPLNVSQKIALNWISALLFSLSLSFSKEQSFFFYFFLFFWDMHIKYLK